MSNVTRTEAVKNLLLNLTHDDLADLYNFNMECQVNVAQDGGERIDGEFKGKRWQGWTDGLTTWKSFRIPWNASTEPTYEDSPMTFDLAKHADGIGMTGWDWFNKVSRWVAFDFDSIVSHKAGLTHEDLKLIQEQASIVPWIQVRTSTSGNGIHFYVSFEDPVPTKNHNEHAALARAVLGQLAAITGFDFINKVDICGGNMWVWHRKMAHSEGEGLKLIKEGTMMKPSDIPENWVDHVKVITGRRKRNLPQEINDVGEGDLFAELTGQYIKEPLDEKHKKLISYLQHINAMWWWDQDNNMLVTHTYHLKQAYEDLNLIGIFDTISEGKEAGADHNCFAYPLRRGGWVVRRFTLGVQEASSWQQDHAGWTRCYLNVEPDLPTTSRAFSGVEHPQGGYVFRTAEEAQKAALKLGADLDLPAWAQSRTTKLKAHKDGRVIAEIVKEETDSPERMTGWIPEHGKWKRIFNVQSGNSTTQENKNFDDVVRHLISEQDSDCGWVVRSDSHWVQEPVTHVKFALRSLNLSDKEVTVVLGDNVFKRWTIVNKPFQPEYPGDRQWNRNACQLMFHPSEGDNLFYPTWRNILSHVGQTLDEPLKTVNWAKNNGIITGADYLKCWIASLFQFPSEPLPYLFLYGPESSGKSIFHEALSVLISASGYQRAENALLSQSGFNAELKNAVVCVVEEINLSQKNKVAYTRIKDWVTSKLIPIHQKGVTPYLSTNTTHWIQCSNDFTSCPIFPGDTRITMCYVAPITEEKWENKRELMDRLKKEAPDFLGELKKLEIPTSTDRLHIPIINTHEKGIVQRQNQTPLEQFLEEKCHFAPGYCIKFSAFHEEFVKWLDVSDVHEWTKHKIGKVLQLPFVKGRRTDSQFYIGNVSFSEPQEKRREFTVINNVLILKGF